MIEITTRWRAAREKSLDKNLSRGLLWAVGGAAVSVWSFSAAERGGRYLVFTGAIFYGIGRAFRAGYQRVKLDSQLGPIDYLVDQPWPSPGRGIEASSDGTPPIPPAPGDQTLLRRPFGLLDTPEGIVGAVMALVVAGILMALLFAPSGK